MLFAVNNSNGSEYVDIEVPVEFCKVEKTVSWIAMKYGVARADVTMKMLLEHFATMSVVCDDLLDNGELPGPETTSGDMYDLVHGEMTSIVIVHTK